MPPLYVTHQGAKIRIHQGRLLVEKDGEQLLCVPLGHVSALAVFGNVGLTTPAIGALLDQGLEVTFLTEDGRFRGRLSGELTPHVPVRRAQYRCAEIESFGLEFSKGIVAAKLAHQRALLQRHNREKGDPQVASAVAQIQQAIQQVPRKTSLSGLRGLEGSASAAYFGGLRRFFDPAWRFEKRNRRPPGDPVNVLLSFGYTLLTQAALGGVQAAGLDPYLGFFHEVVYNRPALALDLVEEFRPVADGVALWCCNSGQLNPQDFSPGPPERPVLLGEEGRRRFLQAFEQRLETRFTHPRRGVQLSLRQCLFEQARQIADCVLSASPSYQGMGFR
jgi:CRISPR-associated protein Cas1